ncbi:MAG TPA: class I SAM-dependent methyltransferase [Puia sp.]|nr:class I SAM-dependent methyltransferase [Puia sp.]
MTESVTTFAGPVPQKYDTYLGPMLFEPYARDMASRVSRLSINDRVLEIACGTGRVTKHLRTALPSAVKLVATDLNADMIKIAEAKNIPGNINWQVADAQNLNFPDESFDAVVCQFGYMFVPDKAKAFTEVYRVLKKGGTFIFNTWDKLQNNPMFDTANTIVNSFFPEKPPVFYHVPFSFYDMELARSLLINAGFQNMIIEFSEMDAISNAKDASTGMVEGNPVYDFVCEKAPSLLPVIRDAVEKEITKKFGMHPLKAPMKAWIVTAEK